MASNQYGGWASTPNAAGVQPVDAFSRLMLMRYGGRTDNLFDYRDETGYKREMGPAGLSDGGSSRRFQGSGMAETNFGGGNTSSNPGGYNWDTLNRNLARVPTAIGIGREFRKMMKTTTPEPPPPLITPANAQTFAPAMTSAQAQSVSAAINTASEDNPYAPGLSLDDARKTLDNLKTQYFGVGPVRKQSRNPAVQQPKKKSTAPKINPPKPAGA